MSRVDMGNPDVISWLRDAFSACADFTSIVVHPICKTLGKNQVRILCYHRVCDLPQTDDCMANYNVPPDAFARQLEILQRRKEAKRKTLETRLKYNRTVREQSTGL